MELNHSAVRSFLGLLLLLICCEYSHSAPTSPDNTPRIVNGTDVPIDFIPFQVSLQFYDTHSCGGAILNVDTVVTAAHCLDYIDEEYHPVSTLSVRVGSSYSQREGFVYNVSRIIVHENYDSATYDYDIALVKLATPLRYTNAIQPVMVATNRQGLNDNEEVQVSGWGRIRTGGPLADTLQRIKMPVLEQGECAAIFQRINTITDRMFCAGHLDGSGDSCNGDSGGPLVNQDNVLYGLVSWGPAQCAVEGYTGVYTNVAYFSDWINGHL